MGWAIHRGVSVSELAALRAVFISMELPKYVRELHEPLPPSLPARPLPSLAPLHLARMAERYRRWFHVRRKSEQTAMKTNSLAPQNGTGDGRSADGNGF